MAKCYCQHALVRKIHYCSSPSWDIVVTRCVQTNGRTNTADGQPDNIMHSPTLTDGKGIKTGQKYSPSSQCDDTKVLCTIVRYLQEVGLWMSAAHSLVHRSLDNLRSPSHSHLQLYLHYALQSPSHSRYTSASNNRY